MSTQAARPPPLEDAYVVDARGTAIGDDDCLLLYCEAPLKLKIGVAPAKAPHPVLATWGYTCPTPAPAPHRFFAKKRVAAVACGWLHCVATTESGAAFAWGDNSFGQLGTGDEKKRGVPARVALPALSGDAKRGGGGGAAVALSAVACGAHFTVAIDGAKSLWTWGRYQASNWPMRFVETWANRAASDGPGVGIPPRGEVLKVAAGDAHAAALVSYREAAVDVGPRVVKVSCYAWGYNDRLQLGFGAVRKDTEGQSKPRRVEGLDALPGTLADVACGGSHTAVLTRKGDVFACRRRAAAPADVPRAQVRAPGDLQRLLRAPPRVARRRGSHLQGPRLHLLRRG